MILNFSERLGMLFVVNAPPLFTRLWALVRKWLDKRMLSKIHILGPDYEDILKKYIPEENLPFFLGGSCTCSHIHGGCCPSPFDKSVRLHAGEFPYYVECSNKEFHSFEITVPSVVDGERKDMDLKWKFRAKKAINFEVRYCEREEAPPNDPEKV
jgi:hypothetical protein